MWKYDLKIQSIIDDGSRQGIHSPIVVTALGDLKKFRDLLRQNFKDKSNRYKDMRPMSNQPGKFYATVKTYKFDSLKNIIIQKMKKLRSSYAKL